MVLGFGKKSAVEKKISSLRSKMDPNNAPASMSGAGAANMGVQSMIYDSTVSEYNNSAKKSRDVKAAYKSLSSIEKETKKAMKKGVCLMSVGLMGMANHIKWYMLPLQVNLKLNLWPGKNSVH